MNRRDSFPGRLLSACLLVLALCMSSRSAPCQGCSSGVLALTPTGSSRGFTIDTFVDSIPNVSCVGPLGFGLRTDGKVLVTTATGTIRIYTYDKNNEPAPETIVPTRGQSNAQCIAQIQNGNTWKYYLSEDPNGDVVEIDQNGNDVTAYPSNVIVSLPGALCLVPYPPAVVNTHTGHLFATAENSNNVFEIDPVGKTVTTFATSVGSGPDGIGFSEDGSILYVSCVLDLAVKAVDVSNGNVIWTSPQLIETNQAAHPDGLAVGIGVLSGYVYANCNEGQVWELGVPWGPHAGDLNEIANGGSRGDFIAVDPNFWSGGNFPSLLVTQTDRMMRLDPPGGGWVGLPTSSTNPVLCTDCFPLLCQPGVGGILPCPCANPALGPGKGCDNFGPNPSGGTGGGRLEGDGLASIASDSVQFRVAGEIVNASNVTVLWQGTSTLTTGTASGAGVRCVNGNLRRIYKGNAAGGAITFPSGAQPNVHTASANKGFPIVPPVTLYYYASYRNSSAATPCGSIFLAFNATNATAVSWSP